MLMDNGRPEMSVESVQKSKTNMLAQHYWPVNMLVPEQYRNEVPLYHRHHSVVHLLCQGMFTLIGILFGPFEGHYLLDRNEL